MKTLLYCLRVILIFVSALRVSYGRDYGLQRPNDEFQNQDKFQRPDAETQKTNKFQIPDKCETECFSYDQWPFTKKLFPYPIQSPADIKTADALECPYLPDITMHLFWRMPDDSVIIENTGYYLEVMLNQTVPFKPYVTGGPLSVLPHLFEQLHFHWGVDDCCGSEHRINGERYSVEVHFVFFNQKYPSFKEAVNHPDGVAVITFFGQASDIDNPDLEDLVDRIPHIMDPQTKTMGSFRHEFKFLDIMFEQETYFTFPGSLTTAPYSECVTWILFPKFFNISHKQINSFRSLLSKKDGKMIQQNDRALQDFNNRPLLKPADKNGKVIVSEEVLLN